MSDQEPFDESTCDRCGRTNPVWSTPVEVWQQVYGVGGQPTRQGVLCPSCFIDDAEAAGVTAPQGTAGWTVKPDVRDRLVEGIREHRDAPRPIWNEDPTIAEKRLWALLDTSDDPPCAHDSVDTFSAGAGRRVDVCMACHRVVRHWIEEDDR